MDFEESLMSDENSIIYYNNSNEEFNKLSEYIQELKQIMYTQKKTFEFLNDYNSEKITLNDIYYVKKPNCCNELRFNIYQFTQYINYLDNINKILLYNFNNNYLIYEKMNQNQILNIDDMITYLIFKN